MKKFLCGLIALLMCVSAAGCEKGIDYVETVTCPDVPAVTYVSEPVSAGYETEDIFGYFDYALFKEITDGEKNTVVSPMSVRLALSMAAMGAKNDTEKELLTLLGYENAEQMREESKSIVSELNRADGSITVNNSLWADSDFSAGKNYTAELADIFGAETFLEKLSDVKIVDRLNGWIDEKTKGLIPQMINEPFGEDTVMLLVNALYFKNEWEREFDPNGRMLFHGVNGDCETESMTAEGTYIYYGEGSVFRSVQLSYKDGSDMKVYLPKNEEENVLDIIGRLTPEELAKAMDALDILYSNGIEEDRTVKVVMPKFECEYGESLNETLQRLGMTVSFDPEAADFGGMLDTESSDELFISNVIHAAKLKCNEKGTEAAAATVVAVEDECVPEEPSVWFIADRPFIYEITDPSGERLFMGTVCDF